MIFDIILLIGLIVLGIYDVYLIYSGKTTISNVIRNTFNKHIDHIIMIVIWGIFLYFFNIEGLNNIIIGSIVGHWFWNE